MTTATKERKPAARKTKIDATLTAPATTPDAKGAGDKPDTLSAANIAGFEGAKSYVFSQTAVDKAISALEQARTKAGETRSVILAKFSQLADVDRAAYITGAERYRSELVDEKVKKQATDFIGYLRRIAFNLDKPTETGFTPVAMTELLTGKGTLPEKMKALANRIDRKKPAPKAPEVKPDGLASMPLKSDSAPQKHSQAAAHTDKEVTAFILSLQRDQLPLAMLMLAKRAKEVDQIDLHEGLMALDSRLSIDAA